MINFLKSKKLYYILIGAVALLAIYLRCLIFSYHRTFEDDECRLIISYLDQGWLEAFLPLGFAQSAPPLFVIFQRFIGVISKYNELVVKSISLIASFGSIFLFFKISEKFFKHKYCVILAMLIFALNHKLIFYSAIAKQYSTDVLTCLLCLYYLSDINIASLNKKNLLILGLVLILLPFISLPSVFFIGALFILNLYKNYKNKEFWKNALIIGIPLFITMALYYYYNLEISKADLETHFKTTWEVGYANYGKVFLLSPFILNIKWFLYPCGYSLFVFILFSFGIYFSIKDGKDIHKFTIITFSLVLLAAILNIFPFYNRISLFALTLMLLFFVKPLDIKAFSIRFIIFIFCYIMAFGGYNQNYFKKIIYNPISFTKNSPKIMMEHLINSYNKKTDIILMNQASLSSYIFYSSKMNFLSDHEYLLSSNKDELEQFFKSLNPNKKYWLYLIKDFVSAPQYNAIFEHIKPYNIESKITDRHSYLIYFSVK